MSHQFSNARVTARSRSVWVAIAAAIVALGSLVFHGTHPINHDLSWFIYTAQGVWQGGALYRDFIDHNTPLATFIMMPVVAIKTLADLSYSIAMSIYVVILCVAAWLMSLRILRNIETSEFVISLSGGVLLIALFILPGYYFGRDVHFLTIVLSPYVCLVAARISGARLPLALPILVGVLAGLGLGIKPTYLPVVVLLELALLARTRMFCTVLRPELVALAATVSAAAMFTLVAYPVYIDEIIPMALASYAALDNGVLVLVILSFLLAMVAMATIYRESESDLYASALKPALTAAIAGSIISYVLQNKGWVYQAYPALFFLFIFASYGLAISIAKHLHVLTRIRIAAVFAFFAFLIPLEKQFPGADDTREVEARLRESEGSFLIISLGVYPAFPLAVSLEKTWASRFLTFSLLPCLADPERQQANGCARWETYLRRSVAEDMANYRPQIVLVPTDPVYTSYVPKDFDILEWFLDGPEFAAEWSHYRLTGMADTFLVFER